MLLQNSNLNFEEIKSLDSSHKTCLTNNNQQTDESDANKYSQLNSLLALFISFLFLF